MTWTSCFMENATNASQNSTDFQKVAIEFVNVEEQLNRLKILLRYFLGIIIGILLSGLFYAPSTIVTNVEPLYAIVMKQRNMITRDDYLIGEFLGHKKWDRSKLVYVRKYLISNGSEVKAFTQNPDLDIYYELNF